MSLRFECVYCGQEQGSPNGTGGDVSCCGEVGHVRPAGEDSDECQPTKADPTRHQEEGP